MTTIPDTFYRVSAKALICNEQGDILVCKEDQPHWSLPGGGISHGETPEQALKRELAEEVAVTDIVGMQPSSVHAFSVDEKGIWLMWVVYKVTLKEYSFTLQPGVDDAAFIDPQTFKDSVYRSEKLVYAAWQAATQSPDQS